MRPTIAADTLRKNLTQYLTTTFGLTDYIYSKGSTDAWCLPPEKLPSRRRGLFYVNLYTRLVEVRDGTVVVALAGVDRASTRVGVGKVRPEFYGLVIVNNRAVVVATLIIAWPRL